MKGSVAAVFLGGLLAGVPATLAAEGHPDLAHLLGRARLVIRGNVATVTPYDSGRLTVARVAIGKTLRGKVESDHVFVVERHDLASSPQLLQAGKHVIAFLVPAKRNSSLRKELPSGTYYEILQGPAGVISSSSTAETQQAAAIVSRVLAAHRTPIKDAAKRASTARTLVFDEIAARHAAIVADGATGLGRIDDLATTLSSIELGRIEAALQRTDLPTWVRIALVNSVADQGLTALVPTLRDLPDSSPELQRAQWDALARLEASPTKDDLQPALESPDPATRTEAVRALARAEGEAARIQLEQLALHDPNQQVRIAATEALGESGPDALPTLERAFGTADWAQRRAAGRAITSIGGRAAAETYTRLAFEGPPDSQKFAVTLLLLSGISHDDPLVQKIGQTHPDESVRRIIESGLDVHAH